MGRTDRRWIDVREPFEFAKGHIPGSEIIPLRRLSRECGSWDKGQPLTLVCRSGQRADRARAILTGKHFADVVVLSGGVLRWAAEGNRLVMGEGAETARVRWEWVIEGIAILSTLGLARFVSPWFLVATGGVGLKLLSGR
jgi:rhodanese-related sulfurtransferase